MMQLTKEQINRQDFVDNEIFNLIQRLVPSVKIKWDIEMIGDIRGLILTRLVNKQKIKNDSEFYPYLKI